MTPLELADNKEGTPWSPAGRVQTVKVVQRTAGSAGEVPFPLTQTLIHGNHKGNLGTRGEKSQEGVEGDIHRQRGQSLVFIGA